MKEVIINIFGIMFHSTIIIGIMGLFLVIGVCAMLSFPQVVELVHSFLLTIYKTLN